MHCNELPILGICGASGSGKTTLIEQTVHHLRGKGLKVVVAKQSPKELAIDRENKDSARFFASGADLMMMGADGIFVRRRPSAGADLSAELLPLAAHYDLVLVEGYRHTPLAKLWLLAAGESAPPADEEVLAVLARDSDRLRAMARIVDDFLAQRWRQPQVLGCILIGGKSSRMGQPKHLLVREGTTWLARSAATLASVCDSVVVAVAGEMGGCLLPQLPDVPDCCGPLAGLLAVMRWQPWATVLACACDLPEMTAEALHWLLAQRAPGTWAVLPKIGDYHEPLLALYDFRIRPALEVMAGQGRLRLSDLVGVDGVRVLTPPPALHSAWRNVNTPEMLD